MVLINGSDEWCHSQKTRSISIHENKLFYYDCQYDVLFTDLYFTVKKTGPLLFMERSLLCIFGKKKWKSIM